MTRLPRVLLSSLLLSCTTVSQSGPGLLPPGAPEASPSPGETSPARAATADKSADKSADKGADKDAKKEEWDVSKLQHGPSTPVDIDVTEGTWMSVDVSPRGDALVFDLLGDIYLLPIGGGEAKALTSGPAWDMQPRFSPDGESIAFTSDRGGGDNLWVMRKDGSAPQQVTKETFRLVNSPAWSPDGQFLVGRKHFTSRRSLGAGELWMYHRAGGGEGVQLTERPNDQKDLGEPAFSPDGRYVYFSQDTTPGKVFEYNKDANTQIYVVKRLDRQTGDIEPFLTGPGGSIRPTPSPDGKSVAFVRRVRGQSVLFLADVESGVERPLWDGLERDMQESWAIHGVYPTMAWTPDSRAIVLWARGKLHRVDVASRKVAPIPFHVKARHAVVEALRFPQEVAPAQFPVRMLRWVQVSPDGKRVVYQALGHLYVKELGGGAPRRLTRQTDHFEFYPSFSRDGRSIVYTTWDDEALGTVRVVPATGGEGRVLTSRPGHYLEPAFSPDGQSVVYRASADGYLRPGTWSREQGLFVVSSRGGKARRIHKDGEAPHFGARSDRVYFLQVEREEKADKRTLRSIGLDASEERTHLTSDEATEYRVSPDERWVAYRENFQAYIMPFPLGARAAQASPESKALPQVRVSRDAGEFLHWSGDGQKLHWALGAELFTRELKECFSFLAGAPETLPAPPEKGQHIGFQAPADVPGGTLALVGGRVITMRGDEVLEDGVVVVRGNRILAVGPRGQVEVPAGARVVDVAGKTVMPGLVDVHWHGPMGSDGITPEQSWVNFASLAFGVTTIHDPSNDTGEIFAASELARAGLITAPRIFSTGTILYGASGHFRAPIETLDDARSHLRRMKAVGAFSVKSYNQPRRDQRQKVLQAARELEMLVVPEGGSLYHANMSMVVDGHTGIEHSLPVERVYEDVLQLWGKSAAGYTPTMGVAYGGLTGEYYWYQKTDVWANERLLSFVPRRIVDARARRRTMAPEEEFNHLNVAKAAKALSDRGVSVQLGAHGQREGLAAHWELWMFGQGGMTPLEALRASTLNGARYLGMEKDLGSLEAGKLADLIVLDGNPLQDLRQSERVQYTMVNGRLFDAATMNEVGLQPRKRQPFFFEREGNEGWAPDTRLFTHQD